MEEMAPGVFRVTFALPFGIDHVHCYLVASDDGWTVVDTGLGLPDAREQWQRILAALDGPVARIFVTHFHPDHVGASADVAELTGAPVLQGVADSEQGRRAWGVGSAERLAAYMSRHGLPEAELAGMRQESGLLRAAVRAAPDPQPVAEGDSVDGWEVLHLPGHADGHLALLRGDVLIAGDTILTPITPAVGLYPEARENPLADFLSSLRRIAELSPRVALAGHGRPVEDPAARARDIATHHDERLAHTAASLADGPRSAYEASLHVFPEPLPSVMRRFALAETRAHLEYLVGVAAVQRDDGGDVVVYEAA
jgi:glyoxylase-like metal-dependent hydrolase (beta-lactamase superfamily II)